MTRGPESAVGVDLGGGSVRALVAVDDEPARRPIDRALSLDDVLDAIRDVVLEAGDLRLGPVTVAIPSFVDDLGIVGECPAVPALTGIRLASELSERIAANGVSVVPDVAAAAMGEWAYGNGRGVSRFLCVALGTGANAAAVVDGRIVDTAFGCLGDAGHVLVEPDGPSCACGGRGCLEAIASGYALERLGEPLGYASAAAVGAAAARGEVPAVGLMNRAGVALGRAISTWSVLTWPDVVAVAGGVANAGELLLGPARAEMHRVGPPYVIAKIRVVPAALADRATVVGALHLASTDQDRRLPSEFDQE